jgi:hypothetical protein
VHDVEARTEQIEDLIAVVGLDRFLERHKIGSEFAKAIDEHRPTLGPCSASPPKVQRENAHATRARLARSRYTGNGNGATMPNEDDPCSLQLPATVI